MSHETSTPGPVPDSGGPRQTDSFVGDTGKNPDDAENRSFLGQGGAFAVAVITIVFVLVLLAYAAVLGFAAG